MLGIAPLVRWQLISLPSLCRERNFSSSGSRSWTCKYMYLCYGPFNCRSVLHDNCVLHMTPLMLTPLKWPLLPGCVEGYHPGLECFVSSFCIILKLISKTAENAVTTQIQKLNHRSNFQSNIQEVNHNNNIIIIVSLNLFFIELLLHHK